MNTNPPPALFAPAYYSAFRCIADRCKHSCCIDWEICIDEATYEKYKPIESIRTTVEESEDGPCFALTPQGRCPHLTDTGLCRIILTHGEDYLCEICQNHPRFYNDVGYGRREVGLGIVCEEACRLILESDIPLALIKIADLPAEEPEEPEDCAFDALPIRDRIISVIASHQDSYDERIAALQREFALPDTTLTQEWLDRLLSLEILDEAWERDLSALRQNPLKAHSAADLYAPDYTRLLTYFVYRHVSVAKQSGDLRARLGFAILSVEVIRALFEANAPQTHDALIDAARRYSAEIEYSEDNTAELIFALECAMMGESETHA